MKNLTEKFINSVLIGIFSLGGLSVVSGLYLGVKQVLDEQTADIIVHQTADEFPPTGRTLCGFDRNRNGTIDEIKEEYTYLGARAMTPVIMTYTSKDNRFVELNAILNNPSREGR